MKNLVEFAENILKRNSVETMVQIICALSDDDIKSIINEK